MILDAISSHPGGANTVCMVATDAVFFTSPHPTLLVGDKLGNWSAETRSNLTLFKPGVYWDDNTRRELAQRVKPKFKARGIDVTHFSACLETIDLTFSELNEWTNLHGITWPLVSYRTDFSMKTALQALMQNKWEQAGKLDRDEDGTPGKTMKQSADPYLKRTGYYWDNMLGVMRSRPHMPAWNEVTGDWDCQSKAYEKRFGMDDPFSDEFKSTLGETADGLVFDLFKDMASPHD